MRRFLLGLLFATLTLGLLGQPGASGQAPEDTQQAVQGNNQFALDLYGKLRAKDGNLFFSPYSISTALAMTYAGARGDTAKEMADVLRFTLPPQQVHAAYGQLIADLNNGGTIEGHPVYELAVANALWG